MSSPSFRHVRRAAYRLKRRWPQAVTLCRTTGNSVNVETGIKDSTLIKVEVRKAAVAPAKAMRSFAYDTTYAFSPKPSDRGVGYDNRFRMVLISQRDLPPNFPVDLNMHVIFKAQRWEVRQVGEIEDGECLLLLVERIDGTPQMNQTNVSQTDTLGLGDSIGAVKQ